MSDRHPTRFLGERYRALVDQALDWRLRTLSGPSGGHGTIDGQDMVVLCSNNYLALSDHPRLKAAATAAIASHGVGSGSVRAIAGNLDLHERLEAAIAHFKHSAASLVYQTGFAANAGLIPPLMEKGDLIISDELNHGSIIDGVRLSRASKGVYPHNDLGGLEDVLTKADSEQRNILIITDGVFSMDGDIAPLKGIVELAERFGAMTYVDDAHGEGVLGDQGRGIASHCGVEGRVDIEVGTFSKAFGVVGGYAAGSQDLRDFALNHSRTWLLSGSHPPPVAAACLAALEVVQSEPEHIDRLWQNTKVLKAGLEQLGFDLGRSVTPITPVMCGESHKAKQLSDELFARGVFALPIVFPMVAKDKARVRVILNAGLTPDDLDLALNAFEEGGKAAGII